MQDLTKEFEAFYYERDEKIGHSLKWSIEGSCELSAEFDKKYTFRISCIQAIILLAASSRDESSPISFKQIEGLFEIDRQKLKQNLLPLVKEGPKCVLIKTPAVKFLKCF